MEFPLRPSQVFSPVPPPTDSDDHLSQRNPDVLKGSLKGTLESVLSLLRSELLWDPPNRGVVDFAHRILKDCGFIGLLEKEVVEVVSDSEDLEEESEEESEEEAMLTSKDDVETQPARDFGEFLDSVQAEISKFQDRVSKFQDRVRRSEGQFNGIDVTRTGRILTSLGRLTTGLLKLLRDDEITYLQENFGMPEKLGAGKFGVVWSSSSFPEYALKMFDNKLRTQTPDDQVGIVEEWVREVFNAFLEELLIMKSLQSKFVVKLIGVCYLSASDDSSLNGPALVMERMDSDLLAYSRKMAPVEDASRKTQNLFRIFGLMMSCWEFVIGRGSGYSDFHNGNFLISGEDQEIEIKLCDFGHDKCQMSRANASCEEAKLTVPQLFLLVTNVRELAKIMFSRQSSHPQSVLVQEKLGGLLKVKRTQRSNPCDVKERIADCWDKILRDCDL